MEKNILDRTLVFASFTLLLFALIVLMIAPNPVIVIRNASFDYLQKLSPRIAKHPAPLIKVIDIDERSLKAMGQWPWSRSVMAKIVNQLNEMGAVVIAFDMVFPEPDRTSPSNLLRTLGNSPEILALADKLEDNDKLLATAIEKANVVTGFTLTDKEVITRQPQLKARIIKRGESSLEFLPTMNSALPNLEILETAAKGNGSFNFRTDNDGLIRHVPLIVRMGSKVYPTLSAEVLRLYSNEKNLVISSSNAEENGKSGVENIRIGKIVADSDENGEVWLHYSKFQPERYISAIDFLNNKVSPDKIKDNIVFIGTSASGLSDLHFTPLGEFVAGVDMHVQMVEQLLQGSYLRVSEWETILNGFLLIFIWGFFHFFNHKINAFSEVFISVGIIAMIVYGSWYLFTETQYFFDPIFPSLYILLSSLIIILQKQRQTESDKNFIHSAFKQYLSNDVIKQIINNRNHLKLGGEKCELSIFFSDIQGFSSIAEKLNPEELVVLLNEYLSDMTDIIMDSGGMVDKYEGDAIIAFWNAPLSQEDHQIRICKAILQCQRKLAERREEFYQRTNSWVHMRIGAHTGDVVVGNFGSKKRFNYTMIGDAANLAARLEGANKFFGTYTMISKEIWQQAHHEFIAREIGTLKVVGRSTPVTVFELLGFKDETLSANIQTFNQGLVLYKQAKLKEASIIFSSLPEDPVALVYLKRCQREHDNMPENWDGIWVLDEK